MDTKLFRDVLEDAKRLFAANTPAIDPVEESHVFDSKRWCSWSMKKTSAELADVPVNIFLLVEDYTKKKKNTHTETRIITTDLSLDFEQAREAAHLRAGKSKIMNSNACLITLEPRRSISKILGPFSPCSACSVLALAIFDSFFAIQHRNEAASKALIQGCKFTWKSAFSQMWWYYQDAFDYLVTAGI